MYIYIERGCMNHDIQCTKFHTILISCICQKYDGFSNMEKPGKQKENGKGDGKINKKPMLFLNILEEIPVEIMDNTLYNPIYFQ